MLPNTAPLAPASFPDNFSNLEFHSSRLMGRILLDWIRIENSQRSKIGKSRVVGRILLTIKDERAEVCQIRIENSQA